MKLPSPLLRRKPNVYKNHFGHVLVLSGSRTMLGAGALTSLAALRSGAGLVTFGLPKSLNAAAHKKIDNGIMTWPLAETPQQSLSSSAFPDIKRSYSKYSCIAIGPGLSRNTSTQRLVLKIIETSPIPLVIDADALYALAGNLKLLKETKTVKILTPHPGEMARLIKSTKHAVESKRMITALTFVKSYPCTLLLKGPKTLVASMGKATYTNRSGNAGMATAGSGDVLTGIIAAFIAQGLNGFDAAKYGSYIHGRAGNLAAKSKTKLSMIASDMIDCIPKALKSS